MIQLHSKLPAPGLLCSKTWRDCEVSSLLTKHMRRCFHSDINVMAVTKRFDLIVFLRCTPPEIFAFCGTKNSNFIECCLCSIVCCSVKCYPPIHHNMWQRYFMSKCNHLYSTICYKDILCLNVTHQYSTTCDKQIVCLNVTHQYSTTFDKQIVCLNITHHQSTA